MSQGQKPEYRLVAVESETYTDSEGTERRRMRKNADGKGFYTDIAAAWPMRSNNSIVPGVFNARMKPFGDIAEIYVTVVDTEGNKRTISDDTHFFNLKHRDANKKGAATSAADAESLPDFS